MNSDRPPVVTICRATWLRPTLFLMLLFGALTLVPAQGHMGAKYEPADGRVIHGLGQFVSVAYTDAENWQFVAEYQAAVGKVPVTYAAYKSLSPVADSVDTTDLTDIVSGHGHPYRVLLGLAFMDTLGGQIDVDTILSGAWDDHISSIAQEIASLSVPFFIRPGFEFGATGGMHQAISGPDFIAIWQHIRTVFDQVGVENAAWVWNTVNPWTFDYLDYYPGEDAVDWWGINLFTVSQMENSIGFIDEAAIHQKPIMVCESCPIHNGGTGNPDNWTAWFIPYFDLIADHPHLKAFTYISDPWDREGFFDWWDTSLIDADPLIQAEYSAMLTEARYIHMDEIARVPSSGRREIINLRPATNPCMGGARLLLSTTADTPVHFEILDVNGRRVHRGVVPVGTRESVWDGSTLDGTPSASGSYAIRIPGRGSSHRFVLLR